ncbi:MAG: acyl-CoA thioesterase [Leptolyngbya sp. SIOISBB]|nr:acyl-CoA thioesterase [Leptolyngbya sp. SIOISBB]
MPFQYPRVIRFGDTDAAGVVYFAQILSICHEAYEASLKEAGIALKTFFSRGAIAVPITHTSADFRRPLMCGDAVTVDLTPTQTAVDSFEIQYEVLNAAGKRAAIATTHHVCIDTVTRQRHPLTPELIDWLQQ